MGFLTECGPKLYDELMKHVTNLKKACDESGKNFIKIEDDAKIFRSIPIEDDAKKRKYFSSVVI